MKTLRVTLAMLALVAVGIAAGCSGTVQRSPDVSDSIRSALDQAGLQDVTVSQDRDKGIVTLGGEVATDGEKARAETVATSLAGTQVVANQVAVIPVGGEEDAKAASAALDGGIELNLKAALIQNKMHDFVRYDVKSGVVTLTGEVTSQGMRDDAGRVASTVPNVKQVVNDLQIKNQKASSTK